MANNENLKNGIATQFKSGEQAAKSGAKGGKASGATKRRRKAMKDIVLALGKQDAPPKILAKLIQEGILAAGETCTMDEALMLAQYGKALAGNTRAAEFVRDTGGQKPKDEVEVQVKKSKKLDDIMSQIGGAGLKEQSED